MSSIVIAGGTRGIGRQLVDSLRADVDSILVLARSHGDLITDEKVRFQPFDFETNQELPPLPDAVNGLVYCPGTINLRSFRSLKEADFRRDMEINFMGAVRLIQASLPALKNSQSCSIVLFSTVAVGRGMAMHASIAAAKGAIEGLTRSLAAELAPKVRVNCIAPALTETSLTTKFFEKPENRQALAAKYPLKRTGSTTDLASIAKFLLSEVSSWITGQVIGVDGGLSTLQS